jgi:tripartite-type tricarboxylate transporter receptor subunit TctC
VGFAAGSFTDVVARVMAERMRASLGQPIIVENVSGADGSVGTGRAARSRPDGYTIELGKRTSPPPNALCKGVNSCERFRRNAMKEGGKL